MSIVNVHLDAQGLTSTQRLHRPCSRQYDAQLDEGFEESYQAYLVRQKLRKAHADATPRKRKRLGTGAELDDAEGDEGMGADDVLAQPLEEDEVR